MHSRLAATLRRLVKRLGLAGVLALAACAARPAAPTAPARGHMGDGTDPVASGPDDMVCTDETPTGTALERRKCRSTAEREQDRQLVRQQVYGTSRMGCPDTGCVAGPQPLNPVTPGSHIVPGWHATPR